MRSNFNAMNRGKRGVAMDLVTPEGPAAAKSLIARADVVVENFAAGVLAKLGLAVGAAALRPRVVSISMAEIGSTGRWPGRAPTDPPSRRRPVCHS